MAALATTISHHRLSVNSLRQSSFRTLRTLTRSRNLHRPLRFDFVPKSSHQKNTTTSLESSAQETQKPSLPGKPVGSPEPDPPPASPLSNLFSVLIRQIRGGFKVDDLGVEILSIALPAALALAADPLASLVDTAFVGHLGSVQLAAVGISVSLFNLVSKLFNVPLLNITTSFVAEEQALVSDEGDGYSSVGDDDIKNGLQGKKILPSVSTSLALATGIGIAEAIALSFGSGFLMNIMGIPVDSPMRMPAEQFLTMRAFGAPPIVIALAAQGTFRGFFDTKTPLYAIGIGNLLNAILDPILIFYLGLGIGGAAVATVISEYFIAFILLWKLNEKVLLISPSIDGRRVVRYLRSGGLLIGRTISVLLTMTLATSMAARGGPTQMAGHQICIQVWLAVSLLTDALALAGQALLATGYSQGNYQQAREVIFRTLQIGLAAGISLAVVLFLGFGTFSKLFSTDSEVLEIAWSGIWFVAGSQPMNALAFVLDGLYYGVSDFGYAAYSMVLVGMISSVFLLLAVPVFGLAGVWTGLFLFMTLRVVAGVWRLCMKMGPWEKVWLKIEQGDS